MKNAKDRGVVAWVGGRVPKVLIQEHVTKADEPVTYETIGTHSIYDYLHNDVDVRVHTSDMNTVV